MQPFICGAISKTINMPEEATVEDVEQLHIDAWQMGIKAVAIYRDNCKFAQPLSTTKKDSGTGRGPRRRAGRQRSVEQASSRRPSSSSSRCASGCPAAVGRNTFKFRVADCEGYVTVGEYEDGRPGEIFMRVSKQGSTLAGIMDAFAISM